MHGMPLVWVPVAPHFGQTQFLPSPLHGLFPELRGGETESD